MTIKQTYTIQSYAQSAYKVSSSHFGGNALYDVNVPVNDVKDGFETAVENLNVTALRYPGGFGEKTQDLLANSTETELAPALVEFLNWVKEQNASGNQIEVTLVLPSKRAISFDEVKSFAKLLQQEFPGMVDGIEIGNEYSIGENTINETTYGDRANIIARALAEGFSEVGGSQPDILLQMAEIFGTGSDFNGTGNHSAANVEIISRLSKEAVNAIDGVVGHYYYNKDHNGDDSFADEGDWSTYARETRHLEAKVDAFQEYWTSLTGREELPVVFTEWNIQKDNTDQQGLKGAGTLIASFEYMLEVGVDAAFAWPIQHKTGNALAGNSDGDGALTVIGETFAILAEKLLDTKNPMKLLDMDGAGSHAGLDITAFGNTDKSVVYVSSRVGAMTDIQLDLSKLAGSKATISARVIGYDTSTSNGLSEMGDEDNKSRVARREIDKAEYDELRELAFFDESNPDHISKTLEDGKPVYRTYLPQPEDIIALTSNPQTIDDYYFATESDVAAEIKTISSTFLQDASSLQFDLMPYEIVEITITYEQNLLDSDARETIGEKIAGSANNDVLTGSDGNDGIRGFDGNDTLDGADGNDIIAASDGNDLVYGGHGRDRIGGGLGNDTIDAGQDNDTVGSGYGDDEVHAGTGDDIVSAGPGNDKIYGDLGNDRLAGSYGNDTVRGDGGDDLIGGGNGNDLIRGGAENDTISGGSHNDTVWGGDGNDDVGGYYGDDVLYGEDGNDIIRGGAGDDIMNGGAGADTFVFRRSESTGRDVINDFEINKDKIEIVGSRLSFETLDISDSAEGAVVRFADHDIILKGVDAAELDANDFLF